MEIPNSEHSTLARIAAMMCRTLESYHCDGKALLIQAGLEPELLTSPDARYPEAKMQEFWRLAVATTRDECFGLRVAETLHPSALHGLGFSWLASHTLRDAFERVIRYARIVSTAIDVQVEEQGDTISINSSETLYQGHSVPASLDSEPAGFLQMCRITAGTDIAPSRVALTRPEPANCVHEFYRFFAAPVQFDAPQTALVFDRELLEQPLPYANPELARINDQTVIDYLARFDRGNVVMRVRAEIIEQLPSGLPSQESIAGTLHMSLRNLQRRLQEKDTSYKELLDSVRQDLATQYLKTSHRSIGEIGYLLGFSEPTNFARAFKRWVGMTPQEYRLQKVSQG
jgi:AraC-like DNA-binding protein